MQDIDCFSQSAVSEETKALNSSVLARLSGLIDQWAVPAQVIRDKRALGEGPFPLAPRNPEAETLMLTSARHPIALRIIAPKTRPARGIYLHFHGGGWTFGTSDSQDPQLTRLAEATGLAAVSAEYRLAPEHPFPAILDDIRAALDIYVLTEGRARFGERLAIGGESAGAHISVLALLDTKARLRHQPFEAANLIAGCYDLSLTPSVRNWGSAKLVLNTRDVENFARNFVPAHIDRRDPRVSPLYAQLEDLPPALFTVGTRDPLLDDTLFMAARWQASGAVCEQFIAPGGCHVFQYFECALTQESHLRSAAFLNARLDAAEGQASS